MKLSTSLWAVLVVAISGEAHAQTTSCGMEFGRWVCHTTQPRPPADPMGAYERGRQQAYDQGQQFQADRQAAQDQRDAEQARVNAAYAAAYQAQYVEKITGLIRDGHCDAAKAYALENNDLDGAEKVVRICAAP